MPDENQRTPTECLMQVLESFGEAEPRNVIVIWQDANDDICWSRAYCGLISTVGMLQGVLHLTLKRWSDDEAH